MLGLDPTFAYPRMDLMCCCMPSDERAAGLGSPCLQIEPWSRLANEVTIGVCVVLFTFNAVMKALRKEIPIKWYLFLEGTFTNLCKELREPPLAPSGEPNIRIAKEDQGIF